MPLDFEKSIVRDHPLTSGIPPKWASQWGQDRYGPWCDFRIDDIEQRMRWIPLGQLQMGSSDVEEGHRAEEKAQSWVTIAQGFWLFDCPCTNGLWKAIMGTNPSEFPGLNRPVDSVSWDDCQSFINLLNRRLPSMNLRLPTETQWEYACFAGSPHASDGESFGAYDSYLNSGFATRDVKQDQGNNWGLYDLLGNVWEWCHDSTTNDAAISTAKLDKNTAFQLFRRGDLAFSARHARLVHRIQFPQELRINRLGFRCLSFT